MPIARALPQNDESRVSKRESQTPRTRALGGQDPALWRTLNGDGAIQLLPARQARLLRGILAGATLAEMARELGVNESRVP